MPQRTTAFRSMNAFDPSGSAIVHDRANDRTFEWSPDWQAAYETYATQHEPGVFAFDGLLLDGWRPVRKVTA
jgi:hypothetical protein